MGLPFNSGIDNTSNFFILLFILLPFGFAWPVVSYTIDYFAKRIFLHKILIDVKIAFYILLFKIVFFVHGAFILQGLFCFWECINLREYLDLWLKTVMLIFPICTLFILYAKRNFFHHSDRDDHLDGKFELKGSGKKSIRLKLENLIYIKSDDNYVDMVYVAENSKIKTKVLRTTLESITKQLAAHNEFVRVHRSHIVNLRYVKKLAKQTTLLIQHKDIELEISVSKTYLSALKKLLK